MIDFAWDDPAGILRLDEKERERAQKGGFKLSICSAENHGEQVDEKRAGRQTHVVVLVPAHAESMYEEDTTSSRCGT